ncbi:LLM class flavin-dependent oxidoreductase [Streptomyces sp. NPDC048659]|uniref:LLM class flavin-dependent oxidoreductase n=1 Tax=Streptomyces sp. NPDC048659 TaxID=3155489 RepID=UPI00343BCD60
MTAVPNPSDPPASSARPALSVLDPTIVPHGMTAAQSVAASVALARHAERLGYGRLWVTEHHNHPDLTAGTPALLIGHLASATERIRIGSGGVMLPNHPPLTVAEQFALLHAVHPGRIDLGVGRGPGTDPAAARALQRGDASAFAAQVGELQCFLGTRAWPDSHPYRDVRVAPDGVPAPPLWILGSSGYGASLAAAAGLPFAFAHHFGGGNAAEAFRLYRENFRPSAERDRPYTLITVTVVAADTDAEARRQAASQELVQLMISRSLPDALLPADQAVRRLAGMATPFGASAVVGGPRRVGEELRALLAETGADELMVNTCVHDQAARLRSYELVAAALHG